MTEFHLENLLKGNKNISYNDMILLGKDFENINSFNLQSNTDGQDIALHFSSCKIQNFDFVSLFGKRIKDITFQDCHFLKTDALNFEGETDFRIIGGKSKIQNISIEHYNTSLIEDGDNFNNVKILFHKINAKKLNIFDTCYGDLYFRPSTPQIEFDYISLSSFIKCEEILLDNIKINTLHIENFSPNFQTFELRNLVIKELIIENSNIGECILNSVTIEKLTLKNSTFNKAIFNNIKFNTYNLGEYIEKKINKKKYKYNILKSQMKDNYRQLKSVMDINGNYTEANKFFAKEMLYYSRILGIEKTNIFSLFNSKFYGTQSEKVGEKISLAISEIISDYGSNLPRVIFVWGMYLFLAYLIIYITNFGQNLLSQSNIFFLKTFQDTCSDLFSVLLFFIISLPTSNYFEKKLDQLEKSKTFNRCFLYSTFAIFIGLSFMHVKDFKGIETFVFLLNPLSGFKESIIENFVWTEKIALLIHKVIFATFIYHFIITLRRTTKR